MNMKIKEMLHNYLNIKARLSHFALLVELFISDYANFFFLVMDFAIPEFSFNSFCMNQYFDILSLTCQELLRSCVTK